MSRDTKEGKSPKTMRSAKKPLSEMSHMEMAFELESRGVSRSTLLQWSPEETSAELQRRRQNDKEEYTEEEVDGILAEANTSRKLLNLQEEHEVNDPYETINDDETRRDRIRCHLQKQTTDCTKFSDLPLLAELGNEAQTYRTACRLLKQIGEELDRFITQTMENDVRLRKFLNRDLRIYRKRTDDILSQLKRAEFYIVVTGEVSTGKSSFLNLLLEGDGIELPHRENETTSCICEIKYGSSSRAVIYKYRPQEGEDPTKLVEDITTDKLDQLVNFDHMEQKGRVPYSKVEIFMPVDLLKSGIVLVDTPGVESDTKLMTKFVEDYLQNAVGFIYVITNAVDVHKLCRLYKIEQRLAVELGAIDDTLEDLTAGMTGKTLFIANKWDKVQQKKLVMDEIHSKLRRHWLTPDAEIENQTTDECGPENEQTETQEPGGSRTEATNLDGQTSSIKSKPRQSTVAPLAATIDRDHFRAGYLTKRTSDVIEHLKRIVPHNMRLHLRKQFRWFQLVCSRVEYHVQRYLTTADLIDRCQHGQVYQEAKNNLQKITRQAKEDYCDFERYIEQQVDIQPIVDELRMHLQIPEVRIRITTWNAEECPDGTGSYDDIQQVAKQKVQERVRLEIDNWENQKHMFALKRQEIAGKARELIKHFEANMACITTALIPEVEMSVPGFRFGFLPSLNFLQRLFIYMAFFSLRVRTDVDKRRFLAHREECMAEMAESTLEKLKTEKEMAAVVKQAIGLDNIVAKFREQIDQTIAYAMAEVEELQAKCSARSFRETYRPIRERCLDLYDKLLRWELNHLFEGDQIENAKVSVGDHLLGRGNTGIYYKGTVGANDLPVTVRRYTKEVPIRTIIQEYRWLRNQTSNNIARVFGMVQLKLDTGPEPALILEECKMSLGEWLTEEKNLGDSGCFVSYLVEVADEICQAVSVLHKDNLVHGDLSPNTVMLALPATDADHRMKGIKVCQSGTKTGTSINKSLDLPVALGRYAAPELVNTRTCHPSIDVYSIGVILSDLWHGSKQSELQKRVTSGNGQQPSTPPDQYLQLIRECCHYKYSCRPKISDVRSALSDIRRAIVTNT